jgi:hypothetical protein
MTGQLTLNLPPISEPTTATELRDRVLCQTNGESGQLPKKDRERRKRLLETLRKARP